MYPGNLISNLEDDEGGGGGEWRGMGVGFGTYSRRHLFEGGGYLIFPKLCPDMITFLIHLRINTNISCLLM